MSQHLVSHLTLKALDDEQRIIEGWASRPSVDRVGDIVESRGATYRLPIPLLMDHDHRSAVGEVTSATVTDDGIRFKAKIAKVSEPGAIKDLCDSAWAAAKARLRKAVSIGFRAIETEPMRNGGTRFTAWEWFELSLVTVPACAGATIDQLKSIDRDLRLNNKPRGHVVRLDRPVGRKASDHVVRLDTPLRGRLVKLANSPTNAPTVAEAMLRATDEVEADIARLKEMKELGPTTSLLLRTQAAGARATDAALAEMAARLTKLERGK